MQDNLRLCRKMLTAMQGFLPNERITRLRNLAFLTAGLFLAESAHLSKVARTWPVPGRLVSLTNRLRRFLKNPRVEVGRLYRPLARTLLASFEEPWQEVHLILDTTKVGFGHRVLTVSLGYRKRALPLCWSVHAGRRGHTTAEAQIALLRRVKPLLPPESPVWVMGDSEFGHVELLCWLADQGYHYVLRTSGQSKIVLSEQAQSEQAQSEQAQSGRWIKLSETGLKEGQMELTRFSGQSTAFTPRQVKEIPPIASGLVSSLVSGTLFRSGSATGSRCWSEADRDCTNPQ